MIPLLYLCLRTVQLLTFASGPWTTLKEANCSKCPQEAALHKVGESEVKAKSAHLKTPVAIVKPRYITCAKYRKMFGPLCLPLAASLHLINRQVPLLLVVIDFAAVSDYLPFSQDVFLTQDAPQCVTLTLVDDSIFEPSEDFFVDLTTTIPLVTFVGSTATVTILNDDGKYNIVKRVLGMYFVRVLSIATW